MARPRLEIGRTGLKHYSGIVYEEFLSSLQGLQGLKVFREMSDNDAIVGAVLYAIKQILKEVRWSVTVAEGGEQGDVDFLNECINGLMYPWSCVMDEVLTMMEYGFAILEQVYMRRSDGKIVWKKFAPRAQSAVEMWDIDEYGQTRGVWQRPEPNFELIYLPINKCVHLTTSSILQNPEGRSLLRNAFRPWFFKKTIEEIEAIGIERDLAGLPIIELPEGLDPGSDDENDAAQVTAAKTLLTSIRRDEQDGILLPYGWNLRLLASEGQRQFDTVSVINRYNKEISVTVLAQFVMLGMERTGSYALAQEQTDLFYLCLEGWANKIASAFNYQAIPKLFALNGVVGRPLPYIVHAPVRKMRLRDMAYYVSSLTGADALEIDDALRSYLKYYARLSEFSEVEKYS